MSGWIKLHRSTLEWEWYSDTVVRSVFFHLLLSANISETRFQGHKVPSGGLVTGRKKLAETLNFSEMQIRRALKCLKTTNEITIWSNRHFSIISIANWKKYQGNNQPENRPTTNQEPTDNQPTTTDKESKNKRNKNIAAKPPDVSDQVWDDFLKVREKKKAPLTETALKGIKREANKAGWTLSEVLTECCERGWQSIKSDWIANKKRARDYGGII